MEDKSSKMILNGYTLRRWKFLREFLMKTFRITTAYAGVFIPLLSFANVDIPNNGTPGRALPLLTSPFYTQRPSLLAPFTFQANQASTITHPSGLTFVVNQLLISGISQHSKVKLSAVSALAEQLRKKYLNAEGKLSIEQLQTIADQLSAYFAGQGYILSKVYLPPQDIDSSKIVTLQVREGFLEKINIEGKTIYSKAQIEEPFKKYIGHPITAGEVESGLLTLRNYPGLKVNSVFSPGTQPAGTVMTIQITYSDQYNIIASANNYGDNVTGQYQGSLSAHAYNLTQGADDLSFTALGKRNPENSEYYSAKYLRNLFSPYTRIDLGYSYNHYALGDTLSSLGLGGLSQLYHVNLIQTLARGRNVEWYAHIGLNHNMGYLKQKSTMLNRDKITYLEASLSSQFNVSGLNLSNNNEITYQHGFNHLLDSMGVAPYQGQYPSRQGGSGQYAQGKFNLGSLSINFYQTPGAYQLIEWQIYGQYSPDLLTSFSQLAFGGQQTLPAYDTSEYLFDNGITSHLEWKFPLPGLTHRRVPKTSYHFGDFLHLGVFTDYGNGWLNDPSSDETRHRDLADYGLGLYLSFGSHLQLSAIAAKHFKSSKAPADNVQTRYWVGMNYVYTRF